MNNSNSDDAVIQNLKDAGCDTDTITAFIDNLKDDRTEEGMRLLASYRRSVLEKLHREQKKLDCLDYLVYKIEKEKKSNGG